MFSIKTAWFTQVSKIARHSCCKSVWRLIDLTQCSDIKLDNIFVDLGHSAQRFSAVQLGDCGGVVSQNSKFAKDGHLIGASFTRSPEAQLHLPWGTSTDIWSFGNAVRFDLLA